MTAEEHIIAWIESSQPHYRRLLAYSQNRNSPVWTDDSRAESALRLAVSAYREMIKGGDAWASDHDASTIIGAALAISKWELEQ